MARRTQKGGLSDRVRKDVVFVLFTVLLVLSLFLFLSETVMSQTEDCVMVDVEHFQLLEEEYVKEVKDYLKDNGYNHSGVTLTRVVEADGSRNYEMTLYHKNLHKLSEQEQMVLLEEIEEMAFGAVGCNFQINLLSK